ncbi:hypothetical protein [Cellulomonas hominis]|nr:hypothetical protein [Cellulomonas hominis]VTR75290.1 hypothetical protein CHMI_00034 [Cellulomonas hominis]
MSAALTLSTLESSESAVDLADQDDLWYFINSGNGKWIAGA